MKSVDWRIAALAAVSVATMAFAAIPWNPGDTAAFWKGKTLLVGRITDVSVADGIMDMEVEVLDVGFADGPVPSHLIVRNRLTRANPAVVFQPDAGRVCLLGLVHGDSGDGTWKIPAVVTPVFGAHVTARELPDDYREEFEHWLAKINAFRLPPADDSGSPAPNATVD